MNTTNNNLTNTGASKTSTMHALSSIRINGTKIIVGGLTADCRESLFLCNMLNLMLGKSYMSKEEKMKDIKDTLFLNLRGHVKCMTEKDYTGSVSVPDFFREQIGIMERTGEIHPVLYCMSDSFDYYVDKCDDEQDLKAHVVAEQDPNMADYFRSVNEYVDVICKFVDAALSIR